SIFSRSASSLALPGTYHRCCENSRHSSSSNELPENSFTPSRIRSRHSSWLYLVRELPTMLYSPGTRPFRRRLYSAGTSFRHVRSPEAPKITIVVESLMSRFLNVVEGDEYHPHSPQLRHVQ